ncbi:hypothetical protein B7Y92_03395 [Candidatus Saccharibacteria bacterium 32-50-13]|nr:MAG: hypothetical protein B7Y92_03395 [Candidatus Saccharibacteria bacterium 32-50-13]
MKPPTHRTEQTVSNIAIIYNPNSTGDSADLAKSTAKELTEALPGLKIELIPTKRRAHAETLAYDIAKANQRPLIISSSGDGGYHEVVNGALKAQNDGCRPVTSVLPAGNANDHHRNLHRLDIAEAVQQNVISTIDVIRLDSTIDGQPFTRYAHSYIGFGLTPQAGAELNKTKLSFAREALIVLKSFLQLRPVTLTVDGKTKKYDSFIISNIDSMSKIMQISEHSSVSDGRFEVTMFTRRHRLRLLGLLLRTSVLGIKQDYRTERLKLRTASATLVQLDGEIFKLDADSDVIISAVHRGLDCIV